MLKFLRLVAIALLPALLALPAAAETYPSRVVKLIVPFGAGGPADVYARFLAQYLSRTARAPARSSAPTRSRKPRPMATRCC